MEIEAETVVTFSDGVMERDARLLVAGEYPGKNLTVTEADLDTLVANFSGPVPVKVEHIDSPLDPLGLVERVWRVGDELLGRVRFPAEMGAFLRKRDAHKLSVGLLKAPAWKLLEASLTRTPHVPTATLLAEENPSGKNPSVWASPATSPYGRGKESDLVTLSAGERVELIQLRETVRRQTVDAQITALKAAGKVLPATEDLARALLGADEGAVVTLSDGATEPLSAVFRRFVEAQPAWVQFGERAAAQVGHAMLSAGASGAAASEFTDEETEIMKRLGVTPEEVSTTLAADKKKGERK